MKISENIWGSYGVPRILTEWRKSRIDDHITHTEKYRQKNPHGGDVLCEVKSQISIKAGWLWSKLENGNTQSTITFTGAHHLDTWYGDGDTTAAKFKSITNHVRNVNIHKDGHFPTCRQSWWLSRCGHPPPVCLWLASNMIPGKPPTQHVNVV